VKRAGKVYLVGAGPGDPELMTLKGQRCLERAEVIVHDRLVSDEVLAQAPRDTRRIDVGKRPGEHRWSQSRINLLLVAEARRGRMVVRLKGGDPFVFGRGGEECQALADAGIPFCVVPGVTSALAAPAYAGIPVTDRRHATAFSVVTARTERGFNRLDWNALASAGTLVILMGVALLPRIVAAIRRHGRPITTPIAVISRGSCPDQRTVRGHLGDIVARAKGLPTPATIVIGDVVKLAPALDWFETVESDAALNVRVPRSDNVA